jgi:ABC-type phosphate transport system substrate-binding protein
MRALVLAVLAASVAVPAARPVHAGGDGFKVIVHPENPVREVDRAFLRRAYLKKATDWNGETVRPIDLKHPVRDRFTSGVIGKTPAQLRSYWNQQIFSGKGVPPPEADSAEAVVAYVVAHRGAVGYLPASADIGKARVVTVR